MFTKIEIKNFQSHKNTVLEFDKGINSICGESDNGKTAVIRAIRWLVENRPLGTDKLNSNWNKDFKEEMSVKLFTEKGWVQRIRTKSRNGYTICTDGITPVELSAVGSDVPKEVIDFLKITDVNFQYQLDSPYLLSKTPGEASKYLNEIIHLDSIDKILSVAESNKRSVSAEQKIVDKDISELERTLEKTSWVEEAQNLRKRCDVYTKVIDERKDLKENIESSIKEYESIKIVDLTEQKALVEEIENINIPDKTSLQNEINSYEECLSKVVDLTEQKKLIEEIENIIIPDISSLKSEINSYEEEQNKALLLDKQVEEFRKQLGNTCPYCGKPLEENLCS